MRRNESAGRFRHCSRKMLSDCLLLGRWGWGTGQGAKKDSSCLKVSPTGLAIVPGSSVQSLASGYTIESSSAAKGWGDVRR